MTNSNVMMSDSERNAHNRVIETIMYLSIILVYFRPRSDVTYGGKVRYIVVALTLVLYPDVKMSWKHFGG